MSAHISNVIQSQTQSWLEPAPEFFKPLCCYDSRVISFRLQVVLIRRRKEKMSFKHRIHALVYLSTIAHKEVMLTKSEYIKKSKQNVILNLNERWYDRKNNWMDLKMGKFEYMLTFVCLSATKYYSLLFVRLRRVRIIFLYNLLLSQ